MDYAGSQYPSSISKTTIDKIPFENQKNISTSIDYSITQQEGYWEQLIEKLGFTERDAKQFLLGFQRNVSPTETLLRECSYRNYTIERIYHVFKSIGLVKLAEENLAKFIAPVSRPSAYYPNPIPRQMSDPFRKPYSNESYLHPTPSTGTGVSTVSGFDTIHFSYEEIKKGTNNFNESRKLGQGAFGKVYKVELKHTVFACKVLSVDLKSNFHFTIAATKPSDLGNELRYLAEYRHPNVIPLYGWSLDGKDPCLIYQYMQEGSLQDRLQRVTATDPLQWRIRSKIACDAARGLQYLHIAKEKPLIHGDIKSANILLDESFTAKLGDFGLAREGPNSYQTRSYLKLSDEHTPGTIGYLAKEYMDDKKLSVQVDTYAFGVVLLELYTGRRAYDRSHKGSALLRDYMDDIATGISVGGTEDTDESLHKQQDPSMTKADKEIALKFVKLALRCCNTRRNKRPSMADVLDQLTYVKNASTDNHTFPNGTTPRPRSAYETSESSTTDCRYTPNQPLSFGRHVWMTQHSRPPHNLSKEPVESADNSLDFRPLKSIKSPPPRDVTHSIDDSMSKIALDDSQDVARKLSSEITRPPSDGRLFYQPSEPPLPQQYFIPPRQQWQPTFPPQSVPPQMPGHLQFYPQHYMPNYPKPAGLGFQTPDDSIRQHIHFPPSAAYEPEPARRNELNLNLPETHQQHQCVTPEGLTSPELFSSLELNKQAKLVPRSFSEDGSLHDNDSSQNNNNSAKVGATNSIVMSSNLSCQIRYPGEDLRPSLYSPPSMQFVNPPQISPQFNHLHPPSNSPRFNPANPNALTHAFQFSPSSSVDESADSGRNSRSTIGDHGSDNTLTSLESAANGDDASPGVQVNHVKERLMSKIESGCDNYSSMFVNARSTGPSEG